MEKYGIPTRSRSEARILWEESHGEMKSIKMKNGFAANIAIFENLLVKSPQK